jgi:glycerophosphoryl diester phosphodiesterase
MPAKSEMAFLAHRGWWLRPEDKNTMPAFHRAFSAGFGIETDFRDAGGNLVISHDPPLGIVPSALDMLQAYASVGHPGPLAVNIKADGLQRRIQGAMDRFHIKDYFAFDMSIPDMLLYIREKIPVFTRQSEIEPAPALYDQSAGVWLDMFETDWVTEKTITDHLAAGKRVALVSPELHRRQPVPFWTKLKTWACVHTDQFLLCTDSPQTARLFFLYGAD